ncbi:hypothetical protein PoB_004834300 [Plakobranchus ocellatus]|uniref:Uncharacterized protein n=1 Tax=Plakobranchus ocellatus TaxID=259542 RepID=A0AAV4BSQ4_9GAST|nr:hypothetical protein PoB_004834300 [Plakobranchus ocellatus]
MVRRNDNTEVDRAVADEVGQLTTKSEVPSSVSSPGQINLSDPAKVKAARKAMANYLIMPYAKNNQDPTTGSPMLGLSVGPTSPVIKCSKPYVGNCVLEIVSA